MKSELNLDSEMYPPFDGFPKEGIRFLRQLKRNNNREWFAKHKPEFEDFVRFPMQSFIASLQSPMASMAPEIDVNPRRSIFRIYRDTRFSGDKTPYKTHVAAVFHLRGRWQNSAGYYVHIEPGKIYAGGGIYTPDSDRLKKIRKAIIKRSPEFLAIVESKKFKSRFGSLEGSRLSRGPAGFPADHAMIEWLKYKSYYTGVEWKEEECYKPAFVDKVVKLYDELLPMIRFLNSAIWDKENAGA
jgi:uncharacterized protein (TIGR02453 family)